MTAVAAFLAWAEHDRMRSPHTLTRYRAVLRTLAPYGDPMALTRGDLDDWWKARILLTSGEPRSAASRSNELACVRTFYRWAVRKGHRLDDPSAHLDFLKPENHVPRPIGESDLARLMGPLTEDAPDLRRAFAFGAYAGLRVSEAAEQDWENVDLEARVLYVRGKGRKERVVGMSPLLVDKILPNTGGNVVTAGAPAYTGATLQRKVNRLLERAGIAHRFHDLRKRGATLSLARGMNPEAVRQVFGWSSMETVTHYAAIDADDLHKIAQAMI